MKKVELFEFTFWNALNECEAVRNIFNDPLIFEKDNVTFLITPNACDIAEYHLQHSMLFEQFKNSSIVLADGIPVVWLSHLYGSPLHKRITGSNLFPVLWQEIKCREKKACFILSKDKMAEAFLEEYTNCKAIVPGFFEPDDDEFVRNFVASHINGIRLFRPDFIFIGLTIPKQQKIALELKKYLSAEANFRCIIAILGASFEFYLGLKKRAPSFYQRYGTEWLYRLMQEPRRLWKRYTIRNIQFLYIAFKEFVKKKK